VREVRQGPPDPDPVKGQVFEAGERLAIGVEAFPGREPNDRALWIESRRALVAGDTLIQRDKGLEFPRDWAPDDASPDQILESLQPLLELQVELVLPTHGEPADRTALERALAAQ
jgi:glyoxylase-like metal-dependent hydrolase (beta-lactamase superfamily II)